MKLTKETLKKIIKEEMEATMKEGLYVDKFIGEVERELAPGNKIPNNGTYDFGYYEENGVLVFLLSPFARSRGHNLNTAKEALPKLQSMKDNLAFRGVEFRLEHPRAFEFDY